MRVFVSEFVCGGGWPGASLETSLAREGQAMLAALIEDIAQIPGHRVVTTWDTRLGACPLRHCDVRLVDSAVDELSQFRELIRDCDAAWVIAPETNGELLKRALQFRLVNDTSPPRSVPRRFLGASDRAIMLASDKLPLAAWLHERSIPTPETLPFNPADRQSETHWSGPTIIKRRDGAGSQDMFLVREGFDLWNARHELGRLHEPETFIQQPFIAGTALSVTLLIAEDGSVLEVFPVAEQHFGEDGHFKYRGGRIPADISPESAAAVQQLAEQACLAMPGLTGYVGCDIVLPDVSHDKPVLIEINPRLTSSYLGYRQLTNDNIPARLLDANIPPLRWKSEAVTFTV
ncbi:MAG: ATP-grasp fold domain protein [Planctomycetota bacterium]|nr:MAG: ATP-grasp fold domain protein [Planctomycetota bacterium]